MTGPARTPAVVVLGAACRDVNAADRRGWRLGGPVTYAALALARLGIETGALIGADASAAAAPELDLLRQAGVDIRLVPLARGPVFENVETPNGRVQSAFERSDPLPPSAFPDEWRTASAWLLAPVAGELPDEWADVVPEGVTIAIGWQGLLRHLVPGKPVERLAPGPSALLRRARLVSVGADDLGTDADLETIGALLSPGTTVVLTRSASGGLVFAVDDGDLRPVRRYPSVPAQLRDPTGAGDVFLAALLAASLGAGPGPMAAPDGTPAPMANTDNLWFAATAAALSVEGLGLDAVPDLSRVRRRLAAQLVAGRR